MTTFNKELTLEEATKIYKTKGSVMYPDTEHNRKIMVVVVHNHLIELHKNKK